MIMQGVNYRTLIYDTLDRIGYSNLRKMHLWFEVIMSFLSIKGRINFLQLARYGNSCERRYRDFFEHTFDFLRFNIELTKTRGSGDFAIAFDPSYISKSGKKTPGLGYFWSGCASKAKWGLELSGIAAIDLKNHTAFHLEAVQTIMKENSEDSLSDVYAKTLKDRVAKLRSVSSYLVADAWFSKKPFVDKVLEMEMHLVSRLRNDAHLSYLYKGEKRQGRGRPKVYDGKVIPKNLDMSHFKQVNEDEKATVRTAIVYSRALKRKILLVHVLYKQSGGKETYKLYFSTDLKQDAMRVLKMYSSRFQIEFIYRDAKQHTGLNHCQARSQWKLNFHFNMALSATNIAKVKHWFELPREQRAEFSMADVKTINHNQLILQAFFDTFAINPNTKKNKERALKLLCLGTKAA